MQYSNANLPSAVGRILSIGAILTLLLACAAVPQPAPPAPPPTEVTAEDPIEPDPELNWPEIEVVEWFTGFNQPTHITHAADGSNRIFIVERRGYIRIIQNGDALDAPLLDITDRVGSRATEQGLLSVAFPPGYAEKGYFYVNYTDRSGDTVVARFHLSEIDANQANPDSEEVILTVEQPYNNHNGGQLVFGPDGYLYIGMGDGGSAGDPQNFAQNPASLLGKMLRIDVESEVAPYAIPADNPFVADDEFRDEIWAWGLRNPWRFSFDRATDDLYIADVGQSGWEEVNFQPADSPGGENYGWRIMEGTHCYNPPVDCDPTGLVLPVAEYENPVEGCSITGGMVYRGDEYASLQDIYFYGDYCSGRIWGLQNHEGDWYDLALLDSPARISTFGEDEAGNVYLTEYFSGRIFKLTAQEAADESRIQYLALMLQR